jgi:hypothetical protein
MAWTPKVSRKSPESLVLARDQPLVRNSASREGDGETSPSVDGAPAPRRSTNRSVFRAFEEKSFVESDAWKKLARILKSNGGAYALSGPRGAGKSWLMLKAITHLERKGGLALWYPSPSDYSAFDFLSTLSDNFANQIERRYRPDRLHPTLASSPWRLAVGTALVALGILVGAQIKVPEYSETATTLGLASLVLGLLIVLVALWFLWTRSDAEGATSEPPPRRKRASRPPIPRRSFLGAIRRSFSVTLGLAFAVVLALFGAVLLYTAVVDPDLGPLASSQFEELLVTAIALVSGFALLIVTVRRVARERKPEALLTREAALLRERIRYSTTLREGSEVGAKAGYAAIAGHFSTSRQRELVDRPTTVASLIHDFRALAHRAGEVAGSVMIAIDELDKITDAAAVRKLLRDVKGIFEIPNVFFLVSVSDEATRSLRLGGIDERNEFNSSFYAVIEVPPLNAQTLQRLLDKRHIAIDERVARALAVLATGNPRETVRTVDAILAEPRAAHDVTLAVTTVMRSEASAFRTDTMNFVAPEWQSLTDDERRGLARQLSDVLFEPAAFSALAKGLLVEAWTPSWAGRHWRDLLQERWRRLIVRLYIAAELTADDCDSDACERILAATTESSVVARQMIEDCFGAQSATIRPTHADTQTG